MEISMYGDDIFGFLIFCSIPIIIMILLYQLCMPGIKLKEIRIKPKKIRYDENYIEEDNSKGEDSDKEEIEVSYFDNYDIGICQGKFDPREPHRDCPLCPFDVFRDKYEEDFWNLIDQFVDSPEFTNDEYMHYRECIIDFCKNGDHGAKENLHEHNCKKRLGKWLAKKLEERMPVRQIKPASSPMSDEDLEYFIRRKHLQGCLSNTFRFDVEMDKKALSFLSSEDRNRYYDFGKNEYRDDFCEENNCYDDTFYMFYDIFTILIELLHRCEYVRRPYGYFYDC